VPFALPYLHRRVQQATLVDPQNGVATAVPAASILTRPTYMLMHHVLVMPDRSRFPGVLGLPLTRGASVLVLLMTGSALPLVAQHRPTVAHVLMQFEILATDSLWPGFHPRAVPLLLYDGRRTWLIRHPSPPPEFKHPTDLKDASVFEGRHESVRANTSIEFSGALTATLLIDSGATAAENAATLIHEAYHVFQGARHPGWGGNEVELFTYPATDTAMLVLRALESEALRRALAPSRRGEGACWTRRALAWRVQRFEAIPGGAAAYERGTELTEGLATYVQARAQGTLNAITLPVGGYAPDQVRTRSYEVGAALARLLDSFRAEWRVELERVDTLFLDQLLAEALGDGAEATCRFTQDELAAIEARVGSAVRELHERRRGLRERVRGSPGWRVVVIADEAAPLFPQRFDPLNVQVLTPREVLHSRWLRLGNDRGTMEILGANAVTEGVGPHPLFNGVRRVTVVGLVERPEITTSSDTTFVRAPSMQMVVRQAHHVWSLQTLTVTISPPPDP
jgi:hypothetical protein